MSGRDMIGAVLSCYGSRTNVLIYDNVNDTIDELTLMKTPEGKHTWVVTNKGITIKSEGKFFAPGNTKSIATNKGYKDAVTYWAKNGYHLRYSGGMAPDCYHIFTMREGIFSSVSSGTVVAPKLRVLYECLPIAFLIEKAGGLASDGYKPLLDLKITSFSQKCDIIIGSREEVKRVDRFLSQYVGK